MLEKLQKDVDDAGSSAGSPAAKDQSLEEASSPGTSTAKVRPRVKKIFRTTFIVFESKKIQYRRSLRNSGLWRFKILPVVGHVYVLCETLRVCATTANVTLTLMKYTQTYMI